MSPERRNELKVTLTLGISMATFLGSMAFLIHLGRVAERIDDALSHAVTVEDAKDWAAETQRLNSNWMAADVWAIWDRNHDERKGMIR